MVSVAISLEQNGRHLPPTCTLQLRMVLALSGHLFVTHASRHLPTASLQLSWQLLTSSSVLFVLLHLQNLPLFTSSFSRPHLHLSRHFELCLRHSEAQFKELATLSFSVTHVPRTSWRRAHGPAKRQHGLLGATQRSTSTVRNRETQLSFSATDMEKKSTDKNKMRVNMTKKKRRKEEILADEREVGGADISKYNQGVRVFYM